MPELLITELILPASLHDDDAADFIEMTVLANRIMEASIGSPDFSFTAAEMFPLWLRPAQKTVGLLGRVKGKLVARGEYEAKDGAAEAFVTVEVAPEHRRNGYGSEVLARLAKLAGDDGISVLQARVTGRMDSEGPELRSPTGFGAVPAGDAGAAFALARGFSLEQVGAINRLALPVSDETLAEREATARAAYAPTYELLTWSGPAEPEFRADIGVLITRMSTDAPTAGLAATEDVWDEERVRVMDERFAASPRTRLTAVAREIATGRLVAITNMDVPAEVDRSVNQWATLVLREHRGHRLGLAVKLANLAQLVRDYPGHPSITTVNAAENEHMLAVNTSMGFAAIAYEGSFQKKLG